MMADLTTQPGAAGLLDALFMPGMLESVGLFMTRTGALLLLSPLIGSGASFQGYKVALVASVSASMFLAQGLPPVVVGSPVELALLIGREMAVGLALALVLHLVLTAMRVGSELIGNEMAFTMANSVDPSTGESMPVLSRMNESLFFLALLSVDGHHWLIRALAESFERAPVGSLAMGAGVPHMLASFFSQMFSAGIAFAAPILALLMMVSLTIGLIARAVPQVNILEMGFSLRVGGGLAAIGLLSPTLAPAMHSLLEYFMTGLEAGLDAIEV
ncbi:MAG: flagellar biosynthetic protein FliR [Planctomycetota bacterium]|nr:flagellar biosynthetic protein FliR [Planctomycetota bacterium]